MNSFSYTYIMAIMYRVTSRPLNRMQEVMGFDCAIANFKTCTFEFMLITAASFKGQHSGLTALSVMASTLH